MNVLFVIKSMSGKGGGAERIFATISNCLAHRGHAVTVITFDPPGAEDFYDLTREVRRIRLALGSSAGKSNPLEILQRLRGLRHLAKALRPEVAIGFMHSSFVPLAGALYGMEIPTIGCERIAFDHYASRPLEQLIVRLAYKFVDHLTINSNAARDSFPFSIGQRMTVIPNPVKAARRLADPVGPTRKILLSVAGLRPQKDQKTLLLAFAELARRQPDWHLRIIGDGPLRNVLERSIKELGLSDRVRVSNATRSIETEYESAQLFVLPSQYEGFPNSLAEALAHGLPAVGFASCPGTNDLIDNGVNGLLAGDSDRVRELARSLEALMISPHIRQAMSLAAVESVRAYGLECIVDDWERLIYRAVNRPKHLEDWGHA